MKERAILEGGRGSLRKALPTRVSLGDDVYDILLTELLSLKIPPGARIPVDMLVRELGV